MKKRGIILLIILVVLIVLFLPIPKRYDDGGTIRYNALTYSIVKWNVLMDNDVGAGNNGLTKYNNTSIYWQPDNFKTTSELLEMETN